MKRLVTLALMVVMFGLVAAPMVNTVTSVAYADESGGEE